MSDRDAYDQEVEGLERKLTEAEREAAAANVSSTQVTTLVFASSSDPKWMFDAIFSINLC